MRTFVGLDCGGTASRVLAVDEAETVLFRGQSGAANLLATPEPTLECHLRRAVDGCPPPHAVCGAFAGLVGPAERERALGFLKDLFPGAELRAEPDYAAAHAAALPGTDATVLAGTGSLVCGLDSEGRIAKTGGGGFLLGDEGSGFRYGRAALVHYLKRPDAASETLLRLLHSQFSTTDPARVIAALYAAPSPQRAIAGFLPAFAADLDAGADYAQEVVEGETKDLADLAVRHLSVHRPEGQTHRVSLAGGVWKASERFGVQLEAALRATLPGLSLGISRLKRPPVEGAVALAREMYGNRS